MRPLGSDSLPPMRTTIALCAIGLLLAACGGETTPPADTAGTTKPDETPAATARLRVEYYVISEK